MSQQTNAPKDKIRWGIISTGTIAHQFANDIAFAPSAELVAVASRTQESANRFAKQYSIPTAHPTYEALYADSNVDAVYVATPHNYHLQNSADAMRQGKHVLCEKPVTINTAEFDEMVAVAKENDVYLMEGMWTYFLPAFKMAKHWVNEGRIGRVIHVKSEFGYPVPYVPKGRMYSPEYSGGALLEMGIYTIASAWHFIGQEPERIAVTNHNFHTGVEDDVVATLYYANDQMAHLHTAFRQKLQNDTYIFGEKGYIHIPDHWRCTEAMLYEMEVPVLHYKEDRKAKGFEHQIEAVSQDIQAGKRESAVVPHATSRYFQRQMEDIRAQYT